MFARTIKIAFACVLLCGCATTIPATGTQAVQPPGRTSRDVSAPSPDTVDVSAASPTSPEDPGLDRFQFVNRTDTGLRSVLLIPTVVENLVAVGPAARSRIFVGAIFATQFVGRDRVAGLALIFKSVGGGLGPALTVSPEVVLWVDGDRVINGSVAKTGLYSVERGRWGPVENLVLPVRPDVVERIAAGSHVSVRIGDLVTFTLSVTHLADLKAFLEQIPEDTTFRAQRRVAVGPGWRTH